MVRLRFDVCPRLVVCFQQIVFVCRHLPTHVVLHRSEIISIVCQQLGSDSPVCTFCCVYVNQSPSARTTDVHYPDVIFFPFRLCSKSKHQDVPIVHTVLRRWWGDGSKEHEKNTLRVLPNPCLRWLLQVPAEENNRVQCLLLINLAAFSVMEASHLVYYQKVELEYIRVSYRHGDEINLVYWNVTR